MINGAGERGGIREDFTEEVIFVECLTERVGISKVGKRRGRRSGVG